MKFIENQIGFSQKFIGSYTLTESGGSMNVFADL